MVADALNQRPYPSLNHLPSIPTELCEEFRRLEINVAMKKGNSMLFSMEVRPTLTKEIRVAQEIDPQLMRIKMEVQEGKALRFVIHEDEILRFHRVYVPTMDVLKRKLHEEGYSTPHSIHPGGTNCARTLSKLPGGAI